MGPWDGAVQSSEYAWDSIEKFDYDFYTGSYSDLKLFSKSDAFSHFCSHGFQEGRWGSAAHYLTQWFPLAIAE